MARRGALIVFEGCDCTGKSTQSKLLVSLLQNQNVDVKYMNFPDRKSQLTGHLIDSYLKSKVKLSDECIHLIFSSNRWEVNTEMRKHLESGTTLIVDRYSYSGIAYSTAKGLKYDWCKAPEVGLLQPDMVFYLKADIQKLANRGNFGDEIYEKQEFQTKVSKVFDRIYAEEKSYWYEIDANESIQTIQENLFIKAMEIVDKVREQPLRIFQ